MINVDCIVAKIEKQNTVSTESDNHGNEMAVKAWCGYVELTLVAPGVQITAKVYEDQNVMLNDQYSVTITKKEGDA